MQSGGFWIRSPGRWVPVCGEEKRKLSVEWRAPGPRVGRQYPLAPHEGFAHSSVHTHTELGSPGGSFLEQECSALPWLPAPDVAGSRLGAGSRKGPGLSDVLAGARAQAVGLLCSRPHESPASEPSSQEPGWVPPRLGGSASTGLVAGPAAQAPDSSGVRGPDDI